MANSFCYAVEEILDNPRKSQIWSAAHWLKQNDIRFFISPWDQTKILFLSELDRSLFLLKSKFATTFEPVV